MNWNEEKEASVAGAVASNSMRDMAGSDQWLKRYGDFKALADEEDAIVQGRSDDCRLRALGDHSIGQGSAGYWILSEGPSEDLKARFELWAIDAGRALDPPPPRDLNPLEYWLHNLLLDLLENKSRLVIGRGLIKRVCKASAIYCSRLAKMVKEKEAAEQAVSAGVAPSPEEPGITSSERPGKLQSPTLLQAEGRIKRRLRKNGDSVETARTMARQMLSDGASHLEICRRLRGMPRPPHAAWRHLDWDKAYLEKRYKGAVCKWISRNCRV